MSSKKTAQKKVTKKQVQDKVEAKDENLELLELALEGTGINATKCDSAQWALLVAFLQTDNITVACEMIGIHRATFYRWEKDEDFKAAAEFCRKMGAQSIVDKAEKWLDKRLPISDKLIQFVLQTKGKERGYVTKSEDALADVGKSLIQKLEDMSSDDIQKMLNE